MKTRNAQQGMTLTGMIMVVAVIGIFAYCGMRVFPMYQEFWSIKSIMEEVSGIEGLAGARRDKIIQALEPRFVTNYVESVPITPLERTKGEKILVEKPKGKRPRLVIRYEVRRPLFYNLDVVGKFEHSVELRD